MAYYQDAKAAEAPDVQPDVPARPVGRMVNMAGAAVSLALILGIGVWGYKLIIRDVSGIPVVRAVEGPMRAQPKDPGGEPANHQGLAVNRVAAEGTAAPTADTLHLAPRPVDLAAEDTPMPQLEQTPQPDPQADSDAVASAEMGEVEPTGTPQTAALAAFRAGSIDALVAEVTRGATPISDEAGTAPDPEPALQDGDIASEPAVELAAGPGPARSIRPLLRPASLAAVPVSVRAQPAAARETVEVAADKVAAGTALAQIGALESEDAARREWDRLAARFEDYLGDKTRVIQEASSGGRSFYRLRAMGFADISEARRFCAVLVSEKTDCVPVTIK